MSTHNIGFYEDLTKMIFLLSSNKHLISSSDIVKLAVFLCCVGIDNICSNLPVITLKK